MDRTTHPSAAYPPPPHPAPSRVGRTGNVVAALASLFVPGLGQLLQGRVGWAIVWFVASIVWWIVTLGLLSGVVHVLSCLHAALHDPRR